ncbi:toprim domain-containing protein [Acinetobacter thermotolerans]|uniref:toprim domain-containing protein n=1 Tax=Acinetobacter thermotolerans TaxID=3151487 RepID=UPI00325BBD84
MSEIKHRIIDRLEQMFSFKTRGEWFREGICPQCGKKELYTHAINPRIVKCGRINKCGYEEHVKDICEDLFKDWSEHHPQTETNPNAAADAFLAEGRGFDLKNLIGKYTQQFYKDSKTGESSATVRFDLGNGHYWERLIDRPERFGNKKARFNYGFKNAGQAWSVHDLDELCKLGETGESIWITEGIFDAIALSQSGVKAMTCLSCVNYPAQMLDAIANRCHELKIDRPRLRWAFDNDSAGKSYTVKWHERSRAEGWSSTAAQPPANGGKKTDWNDLFQWDKLNRDEFPKYKHYGELLIAETAEEAGLLIYNFHNARRHSFFYHHKQRLYWWELDYDKYNKAVQHLESEDTGMSDKELRQHALKNCSAAKEICNAQIEPLYFQRNEITDESWYYFQIERQKTGATKATFTADQISSRAKFKPRVLGVAVGAIWSGTDHQLETFIKTTTENLREVKTIDFIGYSREYKTYIFEKYAVHQGQILEINEHDFFKVKRMEIKTLASSPAITLNPKQEFKPTWWNDFYKVRGPKGVIALAWWLGSYFAEQIREMHSSFPFMEIVGEAGAGKSRLIEFMWKLSGRKDYEGFDANKSTSVAVYRNFAQIANLPVVLIEGDRNDANGNSVQKSKFSFDELKDAFNGRAIRSKGLKTAGNETYEPPFRGAILISQNTAIQASEAILTRTLHLYFDRKGQSLETKRIVDELDRMELEDACTFMTHCLRNEDKILETYKERLQSLEDEYHQLGITHTRIALCHAQVAALIEAMAKHVLPIDLEEVIEAQEMLQDMARERVEQLNGDHPDVEKFWDVYEYLQGSRSPEWGLNHHEKDASTIAINLNEVYKVAARNYQQLPEINEMKKLLRTSRKYKFIESNKQVYSDRFPADDVAAVSKNREQIGKPSRNVKCWIFTNPYAGGQK